MIELCLMEVLWTLLMKEMMDRWWKDGGRRRGLWLCCCSNLCVHVLRNRGISIYMCLMENYGDDMCFM